MDKRTKQIMGERIESTRRSLHLHKVELCLSAGISRTFLDQIVAGRANPSLEVLCNLAAALGMTVSDLVEGVE